MLLLLTACGAEPTPIADVASPPPPTTTSLPPTATPTSTAAATATPTSTPSPTPTPTSTYTPSPSPTPTPLPGANLIAFESTRAGALAGTGTLTGTSNAEIYLLDAASGEALNLTRHPAEDRAPAWSPAGDQLAFASNRDGTLAGTGNWEIYVLDLADGAGHGEPGRTITRLTDHPAYDGAPAWSPDGTQIAFESYRDGNLEIYVTSVGGGAGHGEPGRTIVRLTDNEAGDYGPAWSPDGAQIAFTSWRDGNKEIYVVPAGGGEAQNLTQHPADDEAPAWNVDGTALAFVSWRDVDAETGNRNAEIYALTPADGATSRLTQNPWPDLDPAYDAEGRLMWAAYDPGEPFETYDPYRPGDHHLYREGDAEPERLTTTGGDDRRPAPAPAQVVSLAGLADLLPPTPVPPPPQPTLAPGELAEVVQVPSILASYSQEPVRVNELVAPSLVAWQQDVLAASGWDLLAGTLGAWRNIDRVRKREMYAYDYGYLSWHKAGRALDLALEYKVDGADQMLVVREDLGAQTYWRMYLRTARQDGSQGEPLKDNPWRYWWHIVPEHEPEAYEAGGKRLPIPAGYYVDVTALAKRHGWERIASYQIEGDYHWHVDSNGTEYWHYERTDGLVWWDAMRQLYPLDTLVEHVGWETGLDKAQSEAMMRSKGVPTPTP